MTQEQGETILQMLESVSGDDAEINARFWCFMGDCEHDFSSLKKSSVRNEYYYNNGLFSTYSPQYINSHDTLKQIRDEYLPGWASYSASNPTLEPPLYSFVLHEGEMKNEFLGEVTSSEEIAHAHAIVQAILWTRNNEGEM